MRLFPVAVLVALPALATGVAALRDGSNDLPEKFTAFAVNMGGPRTAAGTAQVDITINRWSSDADRERLLEALKRGQDELLHTLQDLKPVGSIRTPASVGYDLHYANQSPAEDGGRRIFLATDRPVGTVGSDELAEKGGLSVHVHRAAHERPRRRRRQAVTGDEGHRQRPHRPARKLRGATRTAEPGSEYREMPGLRLTPTQARHLWQLMRPCVMRPCVTLS